MSFRCPAVIGLCLIPWGVQGAVRTVEVDMGPFIESLEGVGLVSVRAKGGWLRSQKVGDQLRLGDSFTTGPKASIRLAFDQGVQVLVAPNSHISISQVRERERFLTQVLHLTQGKVRVLVYKLSDAKKQEALAAGEIAQNTLDRQSAAHKFLVTTPQMVLGVWGTDFVVTSEEDQSDVHTFSGEVEIALNQKDLKAARSRFVSAGKTAVAKKDSIFPSLPAPFGMKVYLDDLHEAYPKMKDLYDQARKAAQTSELTEKIEKVRTKKTEEAYRALSLSAPKKQSSTLSDILKAQPQQEKWSHPRK